MSMGTLHRQRAERNASGQWGDRRFALPRSASPFTGLLGLSRRFASLTS